VDRKTVVNLIQEIVPLLIGKKGKGFSYSSVIDSDASVNYISEEILKQNKGFSYSFESSEESNLVEIIEVREKKDVSYKQQKKT